MFSYTTVCFDTPPEAGRAVDIWIPEDEVRPGVALYFVHGGGWRGGHRSQMHEIMHGFFLKGYVCVSVCYRLGGGTTIAHQLADVREGMAVARRHLHEERGLALPWVLYGSSAGGHLALLAGLAAPGACGEALPELGGAGPDGANEPVAGVIASCAPITFEPWERIFPVIWRDMQAAVGQPYDKAPELYSLYSPRRYVTPQSPPLLFLMGECEHMFPNAHTVALIASLRERGQYAEGHIYGLAEHGFFHGLSRPCQIEAFRDVNAFLENPIVSSGGC